MQRIFKFFGGWLHTKFVEFGDFMETATSLSFNDTAFWSGEVLFMT